MATPWVGKPVLLIYRSDLINNKETAWIDIEPDRRSSAAGIGKQE
jgi:hypothetical protein